MSVNVGQRNVPDTPQNRCLNACNAAMKLAMHTIKLCNNKNVFLPEYQSALTDKIIGTATEIYTDSYGANNIYVNNDADQYRERKRLQNTSINKCYQLLGLIQMAKRLFHLRSNKVKYWSKLTINARDLLKRWRDSDSERYGKLLS